MNKADIIRYGASTAIGIAMSGALLGAMGSKHVSGPQSSASNAIHAASASFTQSLQSVDAGLSAAAQTLAAAVTASFGPVTKTQFDAVSERFFTRTDDTQALTFFQTFNDQQTALNFATANAEGISRFSAAGQDLFLAATHAARDPRKNGRNFVFSGSENRLPMVLVSGDAIRTKIGDALANDAPVASDIYGLSAAGLGTFKSVKIPESGTNGFWRMLSVRAASADGQSATVGVIAAFVDTAALFGAQSLPPVDVYGPVAISALPDARNIDANKSISQIGVSAGRQGYILSMPAQTAPQTRQGASTLDWIFSILGGFTAWLAAFYAMSVDNAGRTEAERRLALHRREFKKRTADLKRSEDRFRRLAESTNVIPWAADLNQGRFTYIGPQIERLSGYPARSWCARGFWADHVHPEDRRKISAIIRKLKSGDFTTIEYRVRSADGRVIHIRNMLTVITSKSRDGTAILAAQGYLLDITEMKTAEITLDEARKAAEQSNKSKSEFLANMSHELRTPLNSVIGFAEVMKDEVFGAIGERYKEYAESIHASGQHLLSLINDVLDLSKIEAGKIELVEEETDIAVVLSKCRQLLHEHASQAGLHIRLEIPKPLPFLVVDGRRIKQVILNLMSNALKFTPPGGRIILHAEVIEGQGLIISVSDTGIGMSEEEVTVALEQFGQIDSELSRQHDGTGLGLPIASSLAELHGGALDVTSQKDVGTTVTIWLPMSRIVTTVPNDSANTG